MKAISSIAVAASVLASAAGSASAYVVTLHDILVSSARFGSTPAQAPAVGIFSGNPAIGSPVLRSSLGVRGVASSAGLLDGRIDASLPASGAADRSFFDLFYDVSDNTAGLHRLFGDCDVIDSGGGTTTVVGLLLPAVQKIREAAARMRVVVPMGGDLVQELTWDIELLNPGASFGQIGVEAGVDSFFDVFFDVNYAPPALGRLTAQGPDIRIPLQSAEYSVPAPASAALFLGLGLAAGRRRR